MKKNKYNTFILLVFMFFTLLLLCEGGQTEEVSIGITGKVLCIEGIEKTDTLFTGTEKGLYRTEDMGISWERVDLPGEVSDVRDIAVTKEDMFIAAGGGIYTGGFNISWERLPGATDIIGVSATCKKEADNSMLAWSREELFYIAKGKSLEHITPIALTKPIDDVFCRSGSIFLASGGDVYRSSDGGKVWDRIFLLKEGDSSEENGETHELEDTTGEFSIIGSIDSFGREDAVIATKGGIFIIDGQKHLPDRIDTTGLPRAHVRFATYAGGGLFAATDKNVFLYSGNGNGWQPFFQRTLHGSISLLAGHTDSKGRAWLWTAGENGLYKQMIDFFPELEKMYIDMNDFYGKPGQHLSVQEVQRMAIEYAEVSPEKIKRWRSGAKWKALLPKVSLNFSESTDDNIEIYKSSTKAYAVVGPREVDNDWGIGFTWDFSDLIWNDAQTNIDIRSKLMVQLRDDILEEVTRLYFERKRLLIEIDKLKGETSRGALLEKKMRVEELTAYVDAFTGGKFSESLTIDKK